MFGLYATTGRAVSFLAPMMYGLAIALGARILGDGVDATHWGILGIVVVIALGLILMIPVKSQKELIGESAS